jgi:aminoglycoside phosphotransferase (APT) family kinase protein
LSTPEVRESTQNVGAPIRQDAFVAQAAIDVGFVAAHLARRLGDDPVEVERLTAGKSSSATFAADVDGRQVVVKVNRDATVLRGSADNLAALAGVGIPSPRLLAYDEVASVGVLVMERLPGRDLGAVVDGMSAGQLSALAEEVIDIEMRARSLPPKDGCGFVAVSQPATRSWMDVVVRPNGYRWAEPIPRDTVALKQRLDEAVDAAGGYLSTVTGTCFLDDLTTKNVLIDDGRLSGVVDFDVVCYGDPLFHIGLTAAAIDANHPGSGFYVAELIRVAELSDAEVAVVDLYRALFLVNFLGAESPTKAGAWRRRAVEAAEAALNAAAAAF